MAKKKQEGGAAVAESELDLFSLDPNNARLHPDKNKKLIESSISELGMGRSIVVDENNTVIAGNGTLEAAKKVGIKKVRVIETDGDEIIAIKRANLSPLQKTRLALLDNKATDESKFNAKVLKQLVTANPAQGLLTDIFDERDLRKFHFEQEQAQPLAAGGTEVEPELATEGADAPADPALPTSQQVRMVQLYLNVETQPRFAGMIRALGKRMQTKSITETVMAVIEKVHANLPEEEQFKG